VARLLIVTVILVAVGLTALARAGTDAGVQPLVKLVGWTVDVDRDSVIEIAYDRPTAERAWADDVGNDRRLGLGSPFTYGFLGRLEHVDFERQAVIVWSGGQSSCPGWLRSIDVVDGTVTIETGQRVLFGCDDLFEPYRMLLAVDLTRLPAPHDLPTDDVMVDGSRRGTATTYPYGPPTEQ
jgi:hypothetical protein